MRNRFDRMLAQPTRCNWCTGLLNGLPATFKSNDDSRHYCSTDCRKEGEDRQLRYTATLAGTVSSHWFVALAIILAFAMGAFTFTPKARAHDPNTHQANDLSNARSKHAGLCCNGQDYTVISSWERTEKGYRIHFAGQWVHLPYEAEVSNMPNPDGEAKAWIVLDESGAPYVRCFMRGAEG